MKVEYAANSDTGLRRENNQDAHGIREADAGTDKGTLFVVCDGMGGHMAGEVASQIGVTTILNGYFASSQAPDDALEEAFAEANQAIYREGRGTMGTTGVAALLLAPTLYVANVGDSRAYLLRDGELLQISQDHSFVAEQVAAGLLSPAEARTSSYRNMITRALGHQGEVQVDLFTQTLQPRDIILLSSDGLHGVIEEAEIAETLMRMPLADAVQHLVGQANAAGGPDNITVIAAQVDSADAAEATATAATTTPAESLTPDDSPPPPGADLSTRNDAPPPVERPLTRMGLLLALATLLILVSAGAFALLTPDNAPASPAPPASPPTTTVATLARPTATLAPNPTRPAPTPRPAASPTSLP